MTCDKPQPASESDIFRNISSSTHTQTRAHTSPEGPWHEEGRNDVVQVVLCNAAFRLFVRFGLEEVRLYDREKDTSVSFHGSSGLSEDPNAHTCDRRSSNPVNTCHEKPAEPSAHSVNPTGSHTLLVYTHYTQTHLDPFGHNFRQLKFQNVIVLNKGSFLP